MIYCGTDKTELIYFHLDENKDELGTIVMEQDSDDNVFYVRTYCNPDWEWKFAYTASHYEMVKHAIFDAGFDSKDMNDFLFALDTIFEEYFNEIIMWDCDCDGSCNCCNCK